MTPPVCAVLVPQDRLNEIQGRWRQYKELLESTHSFLQEEFPEWLQHVEADIPNTLDDAQQQREASQVMVGWGWGGYYASAHSSVEAKAPHSWYVQRMPPYGTGISYYAFIYYF